jgi:hypothetical protein
MAARIDGGKLSHVTGGPRTTTPEVADRVVAITLRSPEITPETD